MKKEYQAPDAVILEVAVEKGFAQSIEDDEANRLYDNWGDES